MINYRRYLVTLSLACVATVLVQNGCVSGLGAGPAASSDELNSMVDEISVGQQDRLVNDGRQSRSTKDTKDKLNHNHHSVMHNHLSRRVFDRACKASKDSIEEIIKCITSNENMTKAIKKETAAECYKDSFGIDFEPEDMKKHREMICNNRDKFEQMTACVYAKTAEGLDTTEIGKLTDAMVDVGLCIINALDG